MTINYPKIIFLNLIASAVLPILVFKTGKNFGIENSLFLIVLAGFILSFFSKENLLIRYVKLTFLNSLIFGFLFTLIFGLYISATDSQAEITLNGLIFFSLFWGVPYFFGYIIGIIPQGIRERLEKQPIGQKLAEQ